MTALARRRVKSPPRHCRCRFVAGRLEYPFAHMRVGDFCEVSTRLAPRKVVCNAAYNYAKRHRGYQFTTALVRDDIGQTHTRITRVAKVRQ